MPLVLTTDTNPGSASFTSFAGSILAVGTVTMATQSVATTITGVAATDIVIATMKSNDTGGTLGSIVTAAATTNTVTIATSAAPTTGNGVIGYMVIRPDAA
jgi:acetyl-CoA carboxylase beta subunit